MATINYYYTKSVLETVSENPMQFKKALKYAKKSLLPFEMENLTSWLCNYVINKPELQKCCKEEKIKRD